MSVKISTWQIETTFSDTDKILLMKYRVRALLRCYQCDSRQALNQGGADPFAERF